MIKWNKKGTINSPIDEVWEVLNSPVYLKQIMPSVVSRKLLKEDKEKNTKIYLEKYASEKNKYEYEVTELLLEDDSNIKSKQSNFIFSNTVKIETVYTLRRIDEHNTEFIYQGNNQGVMLGYKIILFIVSSSQSKKVAVNFIERIKQICENK